MSQYKTQEENVFGEHTTLAIVQFFIYTLVNR